MMGMHDYRAELIDPAQPYGAERLNELRLDNKIEWIDTLADQWRDFDATTRYRTGGDVGAAREAKHGCGVYAYYPWARRGVRILPESEFVDLRTSRNQLKIMPSEQKRLASKVIGIVGLSVGQSVALTMALERTCGELRLADFDTVDLSNLNRLRTGIHQLGVNKAIVAAREIAEIDPYLKVTCFTSGYRACEAAAFLDGLDLLVEECDSLDVKVQVREAARTRGIPVLMNTSDRGMTDIERFDIEPDRALFHGRVELPPSSQLAGLSTEEKIPLVLKILGIESISTRLRASMLEIGTTLTTWPQLASDVTLGGAAVTDIARRILLGEAVHSGRIYIDLASLLGGRSEISPQTRKA